MKILTDEERRYIDFYGWHISSMRSKWYIRFYAELGEEQKSIASYDIEDESLKLKYKIPCCVLEMIYSTLERMKL